MDMPVGSAPVSAVTRCPGCGTSFRVTEAQLEMRAGQVRCGQCSMVFDARMQLVTNSAAAEAQDGELGRPMTHQSVPEAITPAGEPDASATTDPESALPGVDFGPQEHRRTGRLWWLGSALLALALAGQAAFRYRAELVVLAPDAKPVIQQICATLKCDVPLPRRAELVSIETSDLRADAVNPGVMVLSAMLRNRAAFAQVLPALELTLTDAQDQALARRVLMPQEYAPRGTPLEAGFAANSELAVRVFVEAGMLKASGYRLYLFYP